MNEYERVRNFIQDWSTKDDYLKSLTRQIYEYNLGKYKTHLEIMSKHPYPDEYVDFKDGVKYAIWSIKSPWNLDEQKT